MERIPEILAALLAGLLLLLSLGCLILTIGRPRLAPAVGGRPPRLEFVVRTADPPRPVPWTGSDLLFLTGIFLFVTIGTAKLEQAVFGPLRPAVTPVTPAEGTSQTPAATGVATATGTASPAEPSPAAQPRPPRPIGREIRLDSLTKLLSFGLIVVFLRRIGATPADLGAGPGPLRRDLLLGLCGFLGVMPWAMLAKALVFRQAPEQAGVHPIVQWLRADGSGTAWAMGALAVLVMAPFFEEFVFRGLIQGWGESVEARLLSGRTGGAITILLTSLLFAGIHATWPDPVPLFLVALMLGHLKRITGGLAAPIAMHFLINFTTFSALVVEVLRAGPT